MLMLSPEITEAARAEIAAAVPRSDAGMVWKLLEFTELEIRLLSGPVKMEARHNFLCRTGDPAGGEGCFWAVRTGPR